MRPTRRSVPIAAPDGEARCPERRESSRAGAAKSCRSPRPARGAPARPRTRTSSASTAREQERPGACAGTRRGRTCRRRTTARTHRPAKRIRSARSALYAPARELEVRFDQVDAGDVRPGEQRRASRERDLAGAAADVEDVRRPGMRSDRTAAPPAARSPRPGREGCAPSIRRPSRGPGGCGRSRPQHATASCRSAAFRRAVCRHHTVRHAHAGRLPAARRRPVAVRRHGLRRPAGRRRLAAYLRSRRASCRSAPPEGAARDLRALGGAGADGDDRARSPPMLYDYYGFPPASYEITWPAPGEPALAARVRDAARRARASRPPTDDDARLRPRHLRPAQAHLPRRRRPDGAALAAGAASIPRSTSRSAARSRRCATRASSSSAAG